jgi:hypothetical protein
MNRRTAGNEMFPAFLRQRIAQLLRNISLQSRNGRNTVYILINFILSRTASEKSETEHFTLRRRQPLFPWESSENAPC